MDNLFCNIRAVFDVFLGFFRYIKVVFSLYKVIAKNILSGLDQRFKIPHMGDTESLDQ